MAEKNNVVPLKIPGRHDFLLRPKATSADELVLDISESRGHRGIVGKKELKWSRFVKYFETPVVDQTITRKQYHALKNADVKSKHKNIGGHFSGGYYKDKKRRVADLVTKCVVSLDIDDCTMDVVGAFGPFNDGPLADYEFIMHTTRSHTRASPRIRLILPLAQAATAERTVILTRLVAKLLDPSMHLVTTESFRAGQIMFYPSTNSDDAADYIFHHNTGKLLDCDEFIAESDWSGAYDDTLPRHPSEVAVGDPTKRLGDPREKPGWIGAFCRTYDIHDAIAEFLPDLYFRDAIDSDRYKWGPGTGAAGASVYDDGLHMFSRHGTDPCADRNVNAFDLVMVHKFGHLDKEEFDGKPRPSETKSFKAMVEFCQGLEAVKTEKTDREYEQLALIDESMPGEDEPDEDVPPQDNPVVEVTSVRAATRARVQDKKWLSKLDHDQNGILKSHGGNVAKIIENDPRTAGKIRFNLNQERLVIVGRIYCKFSGYDSGPVRDSVNGDAFPDNVYFIIQVILENPPTARLRGYGLSPKRSDIRDACDAIGAKYAFDPVRDYFVGLPDWDGVPRIADLFTRYCHVPATALLRDMASKFMLGVVARAYEPGCKFDFMISMDGAEGIQKSTFFSKLLPNETWFGELRTDLNDEQKFVEATQGKLIVEVGELSSFSRADDAKIKQMLSGRSETLRAAYARNARDFLRRAVLVGTTNKTVYLKGADGQRRIWPVAVPNKAIDIRSLVLDRDQLWAEAKARYLALAVESLDGDLWLALDPENLAAAVAAQNERVEADPDGELAGRIEAWLDTPVPIKRAACGYRPDSELDESEDGPTSVRRVTCVADIEFYVLGHATPKHDYRISRAIGQAMGRLAPIWRKGKTAKWISGGLGTQKVWTRSGDGDL